VATLAGFAAAQVSIEKIDGAVYPEGMSDQDIRRFHAQAESAANKPNGLLACSTKSHGCDLRESGSSWRRMPNSVAVDGEAASVGGLFQSPHRPGAPSPTTSAPIPAS
jgi:hypothetical protein